MSRKDQKVFSKKNFNNLLSYGWAFIKRLLLTYSFFGIVAIGPAFLIAFGLDWWGIILPKIIKKILITVVPIIGALLISLFKEDDYQDEYSMDLALAGWLAIIIWAWNYF